MTLDDLARWREQVLRWEFCALLHDVGKLSGKFLDYRRSWHLDAEGYWKDPHDTGWVGDGAAQAALDPLAACEEYAELFKAFRAPLDGAGFSVRSAVDEHTAPKDDFGRLLKAADGVDSRDDRNNPLAGCEQTNHAAPDSRAAVYRSNVFGWERELDREEVETARRGLYAVLQSLLPAPETERLYRASRKEVKQFLSVGLADTTRPDNDTTLWEHSYSVASITKALHCDWRLVQGENPGAKPPQAHEAAFTLWGCGFDGLRFLATSHKIRDLVGRQRLLDDVLDAITWDLEFTLALGNCAYRDSGRLVFLTPRATAAIRGDLEHRVMKLCIERSGGELTPRFTLSGEAKSLTTVVQVLEDLREAVKRPARGYSQVLAEQFACAWQGHAKVRDICPVCQFRPAEEGDERLCRQCAGRRRDASQPTEHARQTPFVREIGDRVALLVLRFGLKEWLDGKLVRTCLVTPPRAVEQTAEALLRDEFKMEKPKDIKNWLEAHTTGVSYDTLLGELEECRKNEVESPAVSLFDRAFDGKERGKLRLNRNFNTANSAWNALAPQATAAELLAVVCAKSPTPSTTLDVWETTRAFLAETVKQTLEDELPAHSRWWLSVEGNVDAPNGQTYDAMLEDVGPVEVFWDRARQRFWLLGRELSDEPIAKQLTIEDRTYRVTGGRKEDGVYHPFRMIASAPDQMLALVPARRAMEITKSIREKYEERFAKVYGRLPLAVGHVYFPQHLPMFAVLDAGRRLGETFRRLHEETPWQEGHLPVEAQAPGVRLKLGDGQDDCFHPYVLTKERHEAKSRFRTGLGWVARIEDVDLEKTEVKYRPNRFDSEWLGTAADRLRLSRERAGMELEEAGEKLSGLWQKIRDSKVSEARLRHIEQTLAERRAAFGGLDVQAGEAAAQELAVCLARHYFPADQAEAIVEAIRDGMFERTLELYLRIRKEGLN